MELKDEFNGSDDLLVECIKALLDMDARGIMSTPVGGHARTLLAAAAVRLDKRTPPKKLPWYRRWFR